MPIIDAGQLAIAYKENTVAADQTFKGKQFKISGIVESINTDVFGDPYLTLRGGVNPFMEPQFGFGQEHSNRIAGLRKGMKATLLCTGRGDVAKTPISKDCQLL
ncbi:TRNA-anti-like protein [compost metagenome]